MKTAFKKGKCAVCFLTAAAMLGAGLLIPQRETASAEDTQTQETQETQTEEVQVYSTANNYNYRLDEAFTRSPDSFEAWVLLPANSVGGTIMGNYYNALYGSSYGGCVDWEIDAVGRMSVSWYNGAFTHTVKGVFLNDGECHHVAIVRDHAAQTFTFYLDGEEKDCVEAHSRDAISTLAMNIGVDYRCWNTLKEPLDGKISEVTVYNGAISAERVKQDMEQGVQDTLDGALIGNWVLGQDWTEKHVEESFGSGNNATICTFEKYVSVMPETEYDYTIVGIPDIQTMVHYRPERLTNLMNWLTKNADAQKISYAVQVGDLSDVGTVESYYATAAEAMSKLDGVIPYSFVQGNHDYDDNCSTSRSSEYYNACFPYSKYSQTDCFGGAYEEGSMSNYYTLFETEGAKYLVLNLEFGPRRAVIRWAGRVCERYPDRRVIINTHAYVDNDGEIMSENSRYSATRYGFAKYVETTTGTQLWDGLVKRYSNIFLVLCGHNCSDDVVVRTDTGINGNTITSILIDPQATELNGGGIGEDPVFLMRFNETDKTIACILYSPYYDKCFNIQNQFILSFADENNPAIGA